MYLVLNRRVSDPPQADSGRGASRHWRDHLLDWQQNNLF